MLYHYAWRFHAIIWSSENESTPNKIVTQTKQNEKITQEARSNLLTGQDLLCYHLYYIAYLFVSIVITSHWTFFWTMQTAMSKSVLVIASSWIFWTNGHHIKIHYVTLFANSQHTEKLIVTYERCHYFQLTTLAPICLRTKFSYMVIHIHYNFGLHANNSWTCAWHHDMKYPRLFLSLSC